MRKQEVHEFTGAMTVLAVMLLPLLCLAAIWGFIDWRIPATDLFVGVFFLLIAVMAS